MSCQSVRKPSPPAVEKVLSSGPSQELQEFAREHMFKAFGAALGSQDPEPHRHEARATGDGPPKINLPVARDDDERSFHCPSMVLHHAGNDPTHQLPKTLPKLVENRD